MIAPQPFPFQSEPGSKPVRARFVQFRLQRFRADPAPGMDLLRIADDRVVRATDVHRAQLLLAAARVELRLILEFEQKFERRAHAELLTQAPLGSYVK